ncbi:MAG: histidine phosphatase family protein [Sphingobium sp.]
MPLTTSLLLLCVGATASSRRGGFSDPSESLDEGGIRAADRMEIPERFRDHAFRSPSRAAKETALALSLPARQEAALADMDWGRWAGRSFEEIGDAEPEALTGWLANPANGAPDGETMAAAALRIGRWLDSIRESAHPVCAITHPMMIRAALSHALDMPLRATLTMDIAPLSHTFLSFHRTWRLQSLNCRH